MKPSRLLPVACVSLVGAVLFSPPARESDGAPRIRDQPDREIPLAAIHTTAHQSGLGGVVSKAGEAGDADLAVVRRCFSGCQLPNLLIVRGDDLATAVRDTRCNMTFDQPREKRKAIDVREKSPERWLVLFLGIGPGTPNQFTIRSVGVYADRVQVEYDTSERRDFALANVCYYLYWIPLGRLEPGGYTLHLYDRASGSTTLMRRVTVEP